MVEITDSLPQFGEQTTVAGDDALLIFTAGQPPAHAIKLSTLADYFQGVDPDLAALGGVTSAADQVPYFTGAGTADVATLTAAARTVIDDATVAAMVDTLGGASATGTGGLVRAAGPTITGTLAAALVTATGLTLTSTTVPLTLPRMTTGQRDAIGSPAAGMMVYNTTTGKLNIRGAAAWEEVTSA